MRFHKEPAIKTRLYFWQPSYRTYSTLTSTSVCQESRKKNSLTPKVPRRTRTRARTTVWCGDRGRRTEGGNCQLYLLAPLNGSRWAIFTQAASLCHNMGKIRRSEKKSGYLEGCTADERTWLEDSSSFFAVVKIDIWSEEVNPCLAILARGATPHERRATRGARLRLENQKYRWE